jgi:CBS domain-containing protein
MFNKDQTVSEVMTSDPKCVTETQSIHEAARLMVECDCGAIPVVESESSKRIIGVITDRDIVVRLVAEGKSIENARVADAMSRGVHTVKTDQPLDSVYKIMSAEQIRRVPVVDNDDRIIGIVSVADVAVQDDSDKKLAKTVENISEGARQRS